MSRPRVGVDARYLTHHAVGGYQTYVQQLMAAFNRIQAEIEVWAILSRADQQIDAIDKLERTVVPIPIPFLGIPWREQVALPRRAATLGIDLVHYTCNTMSLRPKQPSVVTVQDTLALQERQRPPGLRNRLTWYYERSGLKAALAGATLIITPSSRGVRQLREQGVEAARVREIPLGVNPAFLMSVDGDGARRFQARWSLESPYLLAVASDDPRKNVTSVVDALALIAGRQPNLRLAILMSSEGLRRKLTDKVSERGVENRVVFVPRLSNEEMPMLLSGARAMVFASLDEGFGLPPLESMACGVPVVCSRRPPLDELYRDAALMVEPTDPADIARQLDRLLSNGVLREQLVARGRRLVTEHTWEHTAERTAQAYLEALDLNASTRTAPRRPAAAT